MPHENLSCLPLHIPGLPLSDNSYHILYIREEFEKDAQKQIGMPFVKTHKMYRAFAELYQFGVSPLLPGLTCTINWERAAYWHLLAISLEDKGDCWNDHPWDHHLFVSEAYNKALVAFLDGEKNILKAKFDDEFVCTRKSLEKKMRTRYVEILEGNFEPDYCNDQDPSTWEYEKEPDEAQYLNIIEEEISRAIKLELDL